MPKDDKKYSYSEIVWCMIKNKDDSSELINLVYDFMNVDEKIRKQNFWSIYDIIASSARELEELGKKEPNGINISEHLENTNDFSELIRRFFPTFLKMERDEEIKQNAKIFTTTEAYLLIVVLRHLRIKEDKKILKENINFFKKTDKSKDFEINREYYKYNLTSENKTKNTLQEMRSVGRIEKIADKVNLYHEFLNDLSGEEFGLYRLNSIKYKENESLWDSVFRVKDEATFNSYIREKENAIIEIEADIKKNLTLENNSDFIRCMKTILFEISIPRIQRLKSYYGKFEEVEDFKHSYPEVGDEAILFFIMHEQYKLHRK